MTVDLIKSQRHGRHRETWDLLPWLVNGTLSVPQLHRVEQHLVECARCRTECERQRALRLQMCSNEVVLDTPHASLRKLMARIESEDTAKTAPPPAPRKSRQTRWLAAAVVIQSIGLIAVASFLSVRLSDLRQAPRYTTLSSAPATVREGTVVRVVFAQSAPSGEIAALLRSFNAQIVAGPTEAGVYTLSWPKTPSTQSVDALDRLRAHPEILFAEFSQ